MGTEQAKPWPKTCSLVCPCYSWHGGWGTLLSFVGAREAVERSDWTVRVREIMGDLLQEGLEELGDLGVQHKEEG